MKFLRTSLCIFLCVALFSSCNNVKLKQPKKSTLPPVTLNFCWIGDENPATKAVLKEVAEKSNLNIELNFKWITQNDYYNNIEEVITNSSTPIDAFIIGGNEDPYGLSFSNLASKGELLDLTSLFPANASNIYKKLSKDDISSLKLDGKIYAIPSLNLLATSEGVTVRKDLMAKYNLSSMSNLDELEVYLDKVSKNEKSLAPLNYIPFDTQFYARLYGYVVLDGFTNLVYKYDDPKMQLIPFEDTNAFKDVVRRLTKWVDKGYLVFSRNNDSGEAAAYLDSHVYLEQDIKVSGVQSHTYLLGKDLPLIRTNPISAVYENGGVAISTKSKNAARTLKFLNWVQGNKDNYNLFNYGREGKDYTLDNGVISFSAATNSSSPYSSWNSSPFRNFNYDLNDFLPAENLKSLRTTINTLISKAVYSPHKGFYPNYADIEDAVKTRNNLFNQDVYYALYLGTLNYSDIDKIREDLKSIGTDKIVATLQSQLNTFLSNKK